MVLKLAKSIIKRQALVDATIQLVNEDGFHNSPMSKIAKMAGVSPATIYLYFENKQDLINKVFIEVKEIFTRYIFETYEEEMTVEGGFELIWRRISFFKLDQCKEAMFLMHCDFNPIIDKKIRKEGITHLQPLLDLWQRGKEEGIIKPISNYLLFAYAINPISTLLIMQQQGIYTIQTSDINEAYNAAWDAIKLSK
nr:TetR/AcrR family transcriptional regulator [Polaribacter sp. SA4-12]